MSTIKIKRTTGSSAPTGLTFGEPAYVQGLKSLYMGQTAGDPAIRIGAEVDTNTSLGSSDNKLPTQNAVKTYVDNAVAGAGTNTFNQIAVSGQDGLTADAASDVLTFAAGTGIALTTTAASDIVTFTNVGVQSLAGTSNQITVSGSTGAVTLSLPSTVTVPGALNVTTNLTVTGNLTVNGTTTTVNSDVITVDDPVIILGTSGGVPIAATDGGKDRGIAFNYFDTAGRTGFFGYDASANEFVFLNSATVTNDVAAGLSFGNVRIGADLDFQPTNVSLTDTIRAPGAGNVHTLSSNYGGEIVSFGATYPTATGRILRSNESLGAPTAPTWIDPSAAGFTAYASTRLATARNIALTGNVTATGVAFDGTAGITLTTTIPSSTVTNAMLVNSGLTLGSTSISLGSTTTSISGLSSIAATTFTGALSGNASTAAALQTARTFSLTGNVTASGITFDGTGNVTLSTTIGSSVVTNAMLVNSGFTLGTTNITLGSTGLTLAGLSSVSATTFTGALSGNASTATTATNVVTTEQTTGTFYLVGAASASSSTGLLIDATATTPLSYNVANGTLTCVQVEALIDGGNY